MSRRPRRKRSAAFRAKVAIEALAEGKTMAEIAHKHDVHPNPATQWRRQFSSAEFVAEVQRIGARQGMDGRGCWRDKVFVERLWRSATYEDVYLKAYDGVRAARVSLAAYLEFYNARRPHQSLDGRTPDMAYFATPVPMKAAA